MRVRHARTHAHASGTSAAFLVVQMKLPPQPKLVCFACTGSELEELKALIHGSPERASTVPIGAIGRFLVGEENRTKADAARKEKERVRKRKQPAGEPLHAGERKHRRLLESAASRRGGGSSSSGHGDGRGGRGRGRGSSGGRGGGGGGRGR